MAAVSPLVVDPVAAAAAASPSPASPAASPPVVLVVVVVLVVEAVVVGHAVAHSEVAGVAVFLAPVTTVPSAHLHWDLLIVTQV